MPDELRKCPKIAHFKIHNNDSPPHAMFDEELKDGMINDTILIRRDVYRKRVLA